MECRAKKVISGILAAMVAFASLPCDLASAANQKQQGQYQEETNREVGEPAAEVLESEGEKEYLTELDSQDETFAVGRQASEWIEDSRQEEGKEEGQAPGVPRESGAGHSEAAYQQPLAAQGTVQGTCGDNVRYEINTDTGEAVVSGSGPMANYEEVTDSPFYPYGDFITSVKVAEGVTSIGALAFTFCFGIEKVYLPNTLESIGEYAFLGCQSLQGVVVPDRVANIGERALGWYCINGKEGDYESVKLTIIGASGSAAAAYAQENGKSFLAVDTLTHSCGENVTWSVDLANGVLEISGQGAMSDYSISAYGDEKPEYYPYREYITSVVVQPGVTGIGAEAFYYFHNLEQITFADSVTAIGEFAFYDCESLRDISLPDSLTAIGDCAFSGCCGLTAVTIPQKVEAPNLANFNWNWFLRCSRLERIEVAKGNASLSSYQGALLDQNQETLFAFPEGYKGESFVAPDTVRTVVPYAFSGGGAWKRSLVFEGDAPGGFDLSRQELEGLTIYYDSSKQGWDALASDLEGKGITTKDMLQLRELDTLTVEAPSGQLNMGEEMQLTAQISPYLATEFQWSSSDETVAVVSAQGKVIAVNPGAAEIRAVSADNKYQASVALTVTGEPFSMPAYDIKTLTEGLNYTSITTTTKQIVSETLHGVYFLEGKTLGFYSFVTNSYQVVETFDGCNDAYAANGNLYVLSNNTCYIYDLSTQSIRSRFGLGNYNMIAIGADAQGRIYISANSNYNVWKEEVLLFSEGGELLFGLPVGTRVQAFSGFDSSNGCFYMESDYDYYSWGYHHPGKGLTMGKAEGDKLRYIDTYYSFLESGMITRSMSCLLYLCQDYSMSHQTSAELVGGRYLVAAGVLHGSVYVYDSNSANGSEITNTIAIDRTAVEEGEEGGSSDYTSIGVRAVYNEANNSIVIYENNNTISEYSLDTGEKLASWGTQHRVFNMLKMGDSLLVVEKENDVYYMEALDWGVPAQIQIQTEAMQMQVGESQTLALESDKQYELFCQWSSSDSSIVSVSKKGKAAAWKAGTAVVTAKISDSLKAEAAITVAASDTVAPAENISQSKGEASQNYSANNYQVYGSVVRSYLTEGEGKGLTRVEYIPGKGVQVEDYSPQYKLLKSRTVPCELNEFGGFYSGKDANFLVFGQENKAESDDVEVLRVVKYSKGWERLGQCSIKGANTYIPFDAGSLRMAEAGTQLYIHTCHEMYLANDGFHHQANMTFVVNEGTMEVAQSYYGIMNIAQAGYVSHSFNQFVQSDSDYVFRVDHGDGSPRAISLTRCRVDGKITDVSYTLPFPIKGGSGDNRTGVSVGGFELSSDNCLIAGNSVNQDSNEDYDPQGKRNVFLTVTGKGLDVSNTIWLTDYKEGSDITVRTPCLVKVGQEQFLIMWEEYNSKLKKTKVKMAVVDAEGEKVSGVVETGLRLSDCVPVFTTDGLVKWYVTDGKSVNFCTVDPYNLSAVKGELEIQEVTDSPICTNHKWSNGVATKSPTCRRYGEKEYTCTICGQVKTEIVAKLPHKYKTSVTKATTAKDGSVIKQCTVCGIVQSRVKIPSAKSAALKTVSYTYNGKAKKPSVTVKDSSGKVIGSQNYTVTYKNNVKVGKATATIKLKGNYEGTFTKSFKICPKGTSISGKLKAKSKGLTVKWKKQAKYTTGYQVQCSTNKKFTKKTTVTKKVKKNSTTKLTVNKLKPKKKYYVRVRAYKTVKKKDYCSRWSKVKSVTTKK